MEELMRIGAQLKESRKGDGKTVKAANNRSAIQGFDNFCSVSDKPKVPVSDAGWGDFNWGGDSSKNTQQNTAKPVMSNFDFFQPETKPPQQQPVARPNNNSFDNIWTTPTQPPAPVQNQQGWGSWETKPAQVSAPPPSNTTDFFSQGTNNFNGFQQPTPVTVVSGNKSPIVNDDLLDLAPPPPQDQKAILAKLSDITF